MTDWVNVNLIIFFIKTEKNVCNIPIYYINLFIDKPVNYQFKSY